MGIILIIILLLFIDYFFGFLSNILSPFIPSGDDILKYLWSSIKQPFVRMGNIFYYLPHIVIFLYLVVFGSLASKYDDNERLRTEERDFYGMLTMFVPLVIFYWYCEQYVVSILFAIMAFSPLLDMMKSHNNKGIEQTSDTKQVTKSLNNPLDEKEYTEKKDTGL